MGYDLWLAEQMFRPGPTRVTWTGPNHIRVERDEFMRGYQKVYEGELTPEVRRMLRGMRIKIPRRPEE